MSTEPTGTIRCGRRDLLQAGGLAAGAVLATPLLAGCGGDNRTPAPPPPPREGFATIHGFQLHYQVTEATASGAPPLVLIHGWSSNLESWAAQVEHFRARHQVLTYDLRGMGRSGGGDAAYTLADLASDLNALLDHLGISSPIVCGHSMGSLVALQVGMDLPDLPAALVLAGAERQTADSQATEEQELAQFQAAVEQEGLETLVPFFEGATFSDWFRQAHADQVEAWRTQFLSNSPPSLVQGLTALTRRPVLTDQRLVQVKVPTLALAGDQDRSVPLDAALALWRALTGVPGGPRLAVVEAGHQTFQEQPAAFNAVLEAFLSLHGLA